MCLLLSMMEEREPPIATGKTTIFGRELFFDPETGMNFSEITRTVPFGDGFVVVPSVDENGVQLSDNFLERFLREAGPIDPVTGATLPVFDDILNANEYEKIRSQRINDDLRERRETRELLPPPIQRQPRFDPVTGATLPERGMNRAAFRVGDAIVEPVVLGQGSVSERSRGDFGPFGSGRQSRTQVQGQLGLNMRLPNNVQIGAGTDAVYSKEKFTLPPDFVEKQRGFGFNVPKEVVRGTEGVQYPAQTVRAQIPVGKGIVSLMGRLMRGPRGDIERKMFRAGLRVPIPVQGGILGALGLR